MAFNFFEIFKKYIQKRTVKWLAILTILLFIFLIVTPSLRYKKGYSTILVDQNNTLIGALVSTDGQWRFPEIDSVPYRYKKCLLTFEDNYFYMHLGVNPVSIGRAFYQNIKSGRIKSGGSTITMQLARISRENPPRTIKEKIIELFIALKAELTHSKKKLLKLYASHAPFGGNVIGLEAASWRYYGISPDKLTWAEAATLAVLPNSPALIYPGKNHYKLLEKRNKLLYKLFAKKIINQETLLLALQEPIPGKPKEIPSIAPHLLTRTLNEGHKGERIRTSIHIELQQSVTNLLYKYYNLLRYNDIKNAAALIIDIQTGKVISYVGNISNNDKIAGSEVDIITARRSYGSLLKPILYAAMLEEGKLLPNMLVEDIPAIYNGFMPQNFFNEFDGAVPANEVLSRSLNVPSVNMLRQFGIEKFTTMLRDLKLSTIDKTADYYGLSIILGGAESTLWELTGLYASLAHKLITNENNYSISYIRSDHKNKSEKEFDITRFSPITIGLTFNAITTNKRPVTQTNWEYFSSSQKIAWKTGTSFGFRDAWAIGVTPRYAVGVWVGNASGEGRPGLVGIGVAAPIMFDIFSMLPRSAWFKDNSKVFSTIQVCAKSGYKAGDYCEKKYWQKIPKKGKKAALCPYHQPIHLDKNLTWIVNSSCYPVNEIKTVNWFVLPPAIEHYYRTKHNDYQMLPQKLPSCETSTDIRKNLQFIYPKHYTRIYLPTTGNQKEGKAIFEVAHTNPQQTLFWHLDNVFIGETTQFHKMQIHTNPGKHTITVMDEKGESVTQKFEVLQK